jgi:hypothetical protein
MGNDARVLRRDICVSKIVLVVVAVGRLTRSICSQRLEGSRFGTYQTTSRYSFQRSMRPKNVATGGSRESPSAMHLINRGFRFVSIHPVELHAAGSFPGAACCRTFGPGS